MRRYLFLGGIMIALSAVIVHTVHSQPANTARDRSADDAAIRANIALFAKAFNAKDAKVIADLFTPDGQIIDTDGNMVEGREAIANAFKEVFASSPTKTTEVFVESIRFIGNDLAVEVGTTKETGAPNETPDYDRYTVLHVKRDGKWQMALARDEEGAEPTPQERLQSLAWLVGDWIDESPQAVVMTSCRWSPDKHFLIQEIQVKTAGKPVMSINQRIGWDPLHKCIRSWVFDSEGGFGEGMWTRSGDHWIIKATGVANTGATMTATNTLTPTRKDSFHWHSTDRVVGGAVEEPRDVTVVRKPPTSGSTKN